MSQKTSPFQTHQELYNFCKLFNNLKLFYSWAESYSDAEKQKLWPTMDHWLDCVNAVQNIPGGSIYLTTK